MKTEELIDHLKAGRPLSKNIVKHIVIELEWNATLRMENRAHQEQLGFYRERMESAEQRVKSLKEALLPVVEWWKVEKKLEEKFGAFSDCVLGFTHKGEISHKVTSSQLDAIVEALEATCQE